MLTRHLSMTIAAALLAGCISAPKWAEVDPGPKPDLEAAKVEVAKSIKFSLKDPDSAQFRDWGGLFKTLTPETYASFTLVPAWGICVWVNAKNAYGGYAGFDLWQGIYRDGKLTGTEQNPNGCGADRLPDRS